MSALSEFLTFKSKCILFCNGDLITLSKGAQKVYFFLTLKFSHYVGEFKNFVCMDVVFGHQF